MTTAAVTTAIKLTPADVHSDVPGATSYAVHLDGTMIGWVGTAREWKGSRYGGLKWWACWREDGDTAARWNSDDAAPASRKAAVDALLAERAKPRDPNERTSPKSLTVAVERWCTPGLVTRRRDWSDSSAELELRSGYAITVARERGALQWSVVTHNPELPPPGQLAVVIDDELPTDREKAISKLVALVEIWADR